MAGNLSSGVQIARDICTRLKRYLYSEEQLDNNAFQYKFTVVYCESLNLIGYIIVCYLLIVNSYASVHIVRNV